jgi:tetratricopeptide (TPR) repeat protein
MSRGAGASGHVPAAALSTALALPAGAAPPEARLAAPDPEAPVADAASVSAVDQAEALRQFREARVLYNAGQFEAAAEGFARSFAAAASPEAAYNAALAHEKIGDPVATLTWFRRYLERARKDSDPSYPLARARVEELRARVGELRVELRSRDAVRELRVNGEPVALDGFPRLLLPGPVTLRFLGANPGQVVDIASEVRPGETATIYFPGFAEAAPPQPRPPVARRDPPVVRPPLPAGPTQRQKTLRALFWTGAGATLAGVATMSAFGGLALDRRSTYYALGEACDRGEDCVDHDAREAYRLAAARFGTATNVTVGVTAGLAAITLVIGIVALRESRLARTGNRAGRLQLTAGGLRVAF